MVLLPSIRSIGIHTIRISVKSGNITGKNLVVPPKSLIQINAAGISGKHIREDWPKPAPWPYEQKGFASWRSWYDSTLKRFDENSKIIVIDGPPAVGKDDLAKALAEDFEMKYYPATTMDLYYINPYGYDFRNYNDQLPKPVQTYDEKDFIKNPKDKFKRLLCMEINKLELSFSQYVDALTHLFNTGQGAVLTSHPYSHYTFVEGLFRAGYLDKKELSAYRRFPDNVLHHLLKPHLVIYLDCPVSAVQDKLRKRGQGEEKALTADFLKGLEESYKTKFLPEIEVNAELLVYDWTEPGDPEVVVEDIERINFEEKREPRHPKFEDWNFRFDAQAAEQRWKFTETKNTLLFDFLIPDIRDCPSYDGNAELYDVYWNVYNSVPGNKYWHGFNPDLGDSVVWKGTRPPYSSVDKPPPLY